MAGPTPSWNTVRVFGTWHNLDGTLKAGDYTVTFPVRVTNTTDDVVIPAGKTKGQLQTNKSSDPSLDILVPATDDPDNSPSGWQIRLEVSFSDGMSAKEVYVLDVPLSAAGTGIDLAKVVLSDDVPAAVPGLTRGVPGGVANYNQTVAVVTHGTNANAARPAGAPIVLWLGTVEPLNATAADLWRDLTEGA